MAAVATAKRPSDCHPDLPNFARGLCVRCYSKDYRLHRPLRKVYNAPPHVDPGPPALTLDDLRRSHETLFLVWPVTCPHCHRPSTLLRAGREAHCAAERAGCGWSGYLVRVEALR